MIYQVKGNSMLKENVLESTHIDNNKLDEIPNDLSSYWMPFTTNRRFKNNPRFLVSAKDNLEEMVIQLQKQMLENQDNVMDKVILKAAMDYDDKYNPPKQ